MPVRGRSGFAPTLDHVCGRGPTRQVHKSPSGQTRQCPVLCEGKNRFGSRLRHLKSPPRGNATVTVYLGSVRDHDIPSRHTLASANPLRPKKDHRPAQTQNICSGRPETQDNLDSVSFLSRVSQSPSPGPGRSCRPPSPGARYSITCNQNSGRTEDHRPWSFPRGVLRRSYISLRNITARHADADPVRKGPVATSHTPKLLDYQHSEPHLRGRKTNKFF